MAWWLSWLERRPVTAEVDGSSPFRVAEKHSASAGCFFSVSLMLPCSSIMTSGYMRNTETQRGHKDMKKQRQIEEEQTQQNQNTDTFFLTAFRFTIL